MTAWSILDWRVENRPEQRWQLGEGLRTVEIDRKFPANLWVQTSQKTLFIGVRAIGWRIG